ncbi:pilus assembly protein [Pelagibacterium sp. H642]|uniref:TadE/TadG family type IV pilus assembly protein n=1 Tax=Pelagibacterium sp. H642 TaxID=1881069 RepID=UPI002816494C|nr:pilus assembly protein [Pelagibacterium sp. H642]WMT92870.1 pilus assembly protein [Pelagibacterium sp. H642]
MKIELMAKVRVLARGEGGASAVEFALVSPILVLCVLSMVDLGLALGEQMAMDQLLRSAAMTAMEGGSQTAIEATLTALSEGQDFVPTVAPACSAPCSGSGASNGFLLSAEKKFDGFLIDIPELKSSLLVQIQ